MPKTLPASLVFGLLYEHFGARAAFGWGAALALVAAFLLAGTRTTSASVPHDPGT